MSSLSKKPFSAVLSALMVTAVSALGALGAAGCSTEAFCWDDCQSGSGTNTSSSSGMSSGSGGAGGQGGESCEPFCPTTSSSGVGGAGGGTGGAGGDPCANVDTMTDPKNCGKCGNNCYQVLLNNDPLSIKCEAGVCKGTCASGYYDIDKDMLACEYYCIENTPGKDELCNNKDDDCDGIKDEDVDLCTSTTDCGQCGNNCSIIHGTPECKTTAMPGQACTPANTQCAIKACEPGWVDLDNSVITGCEYNCTQTNGGVEICGDSEDNDCDGKIDEADDLSGDQQIGQVCFGDPDGICGQAAHAGVTACVANKVVCTGMNVLVEGQTPETCNGQDDNCDGLIDNNATDAGDSCGTSNIFPCSFGVQQCQGGMLVCIGANEPSPEMCDGVDNNCNGMIDDMPVDVGGACGPVTDVGACQFGSVQCLPGGVINCVGAIEPATETCNGADDDCNGTVDDVAGVGTQCGQSGTAPCKYGTLQCVGMNVQCVGNIDPMAETCNQVDDDCDGTVDDGIPSVQCVPMGTDPNLIYGGLSTCKKGTQACGSMTCSGFVGPSNEVCDSLDNNCDGIVDNNLNLGACNVPIPPPMGATSPCKAGTQVCTAGVLTCQGSVGPSSSVDSCGVDANCDGVLTGQPNFSTDVANCGSCNNNCYNGSVHSIWSCTNGMCAFQGCENGYYDLNGDQKCEYACTFLQAQESCNGLDDNCNGQIDENVSLPTPVQVCGVSPAATRPECTSGVTVACVAGAFVCTFPAGVCNGGCSANDETCDALDNDCDGLLNENVANFNQPCASDDGLPAPGHGACRTTGNFVCNGGSATICNAVKADCASLPGGCTEVCDGIDNDCDALIDETYNAKGPNTTYFVKPAVTKVSATRWIYSYEASRPSAGAATAGNGNGYQTSAPAGTTLDKTKACSVPGRVPWFNVTPDEVEQTCAAMGGFICQQSEWQTGCEATTPCTWGYNPRGSTCTTTLSATKYCNIGPFDFKPGVAGDQDGLLPTGSGSLQNCWSDWLNLQGNTAANAKLYDMTGNLREITRNAAGTAYPLMGGAFNSDETGATCQLNFYTTTDKQFKLYDLGFRCCFSSDPTL